MQLIGNLTLPNYNVIEAWNIGLGPVCRARRPVTALLMRGFRAVISLTTRMHPVGDLRTLGKEYCAAHNRAPLQLFMGSRDILKLKHVGYRIVKFSTDDHIEQSSCSFM